MDTLDFLIKRFSLNINQRSPITVPGLDRRELVKLFADLDFTCGAEIGVLLGDHSKMLCEANPRLMLYSIDPWLAYKEYTDLTTQKDFDYVYKTAKEKLSPYNCTLIRKKSMDALNDFADEFFDFVYIDGNHEFASEANDIHWWLKKVKLGGILAGHDYRKYKEKSFSHSYEVVNAYTDAYRIRPWFITDSNKEKIRSWLWVKNK
jgi:hypothetical protein